MAKKPDFTRKSFRPWYANRTSRPPLLREIAFEIVLRCAGDAAWCGRFLLALVVCIGSVVGAIIVVANYASPAVVAVAAAVVGLCVRRRRSGVGGR